MATTAIEVEDGTSKSDGNSYVTAAQLATYAADRNVTLSGTNGDPTEILFKAMDWIEGQSFQGTKYRADQPLQWPRVDVWVDGYLQDSDVIPQLLKDAQMALAIAIDQGFDPLANVARAQKRVKIDVIEVEYADNAPHIPYASTFRMKIAKLLAGGASGSNFAVIR